MTEWKKAISSSFVAANARRIEIHKSLNALLDELKRENGIQNTDLDLVNEYPLTWRVTINKKIVQITESEVNSAQSLFEGPSDFDLSQEKKEVAEALKELLVKKFS